MPTLTTRSISDGDPGTAQTVAAMAELIRAGALTPAVRQVATEIVAVYPENAAVAQLLGIREWVAEHFQFVRDPSSGELLHDPDHLMRQIATRGVAYGDCDDAAILAGALACAVGFRVALITVALHEDSTTPAAAVPFGHVWASASPPFACLDGSQRQLWIEFDVTRPMQQIPLDRIARANAVPIC